MNLDLTISIDRDIKKITEDIYTSLIMNHFVDPKNSDDGPEDDYVEILEEHFRSILKDVYRRGYFDALLDTDFDLKNKLKISNFCGV